MAKYDVTYACGHSTEVQLYGPGKERTRRMDWMRTQECPACKTATAQATNEAAGLPALVGTPKQVAWAESIRAELVRQLDGVIANSYGKAWEEKITAGDPERAPIAILAVQEHRRRFASETRAAEWISMKDMRPQGMVATILNDIKHALAA